MKTENAVQQLPPLPDEGTTAFDTWWSALYPSIPTPASGPYNIWAAAWSAAIEAQYRHIGETGWVLREVYFDEGGDALMHREPAPQADFAYREAVSLASALFNRYFAHEEHYASGQIVWEPCDTTAGVISQIDNMVSGLVSPAQQAKPKPITEQELKAGREAVTDDPDEQPDPWSFRMGAWFAERHHGIKE